MGTTAVGEPYKIDSKIATKKYRKLPKIRVFKIDDSRQFKKGCF